MGKVDIGFLGGGRMASAIRVGLSRHASEKTVAVFDPALNASPSNWPAPSDRICSSEKELFESARWVVWAIKPQVFAAEFLPRSGIPFPGEAWISIMAGVSLSTLQRLSPKTAVVRTMPNTPLMQAEGMVALAGGAGVSPDLLGRVESFFAPVARTLRVEESAIDGVTAISGSGPAYLFELSEQVENLARVFSLEKKQARQLWAQTLRGAASMLEHSPLEAGALRDQVTSPGGTTQAALEVMRRDGFGDIFSKALVAARDRSRELAAAQG